MRRLFFQLAVFLEREPLGVRPAPAMAGRLLRQLDTVGAGVERDRLANLGVAPHQARVEGHGVGHLMGGQRHRVVDNASLIAIAHHVIVRGLTSTTARMMLPL
mgnify:CR=1 FL=1